MDKWRMIGKHLGCVKKTCMVLVLGASLLAGMFLGVATAAPPPGPGENGYVSMHSYASKTDLPGVYRITQTVQGQYELAPLLITVVLDHSSSMWDSGVMLSDGNYKYQAMIAGLRDALNILTDPSANVLADQTYINIVVYGGHQEAGGATPVPISEQLGFGGARVSAWSITDAYNETLDDFDTITHNGDFVPLLAGGAMNPIVTGAVDKMEGNMLYNVTAVAPNFRAPNNMLTGTFIGAGERQAYRNLEGAKIADNPSSRFYDFEDYPKYVMVMTDGSDLRRAFSHYTQAYALALKLPEDFTVQSAGGFDGPLAGMNVKIWSIAIDRLKTGNPATPLPTDIPHHTTNWARSFFNWDENMMRGAGPPSVPPIIAPPNPYTPPDTVWSHRSSSGNGFYYSGGQIPVEYVIIDT